MAPEKRDITAIEIVWRNPWVRALTYILGAIALIALLVLNNHKYAFALQVAIIGFVIAYVLNPVVKALQRLRIGRAPAVLIVYFVLLILLVLGSVLVSHVVSELSRFVNLIPQALDRLTPLLERSFSWGAALTERLPDFIRDRLVLPTGDEASLADAFRTTLENYLVQATKGILTALQNLLGNSGSFLLTGVASILSTTLQVLLILLTSAYFLYDFPRFSQNLRRYVPVRWRPLYNDIIAKVDVAVGGYMRGQLLITTILGFFIWIGLTIIGVPLAPAISFLAAIFNLIPYLGPVIGVIPAVLLGLTVSPLTALLAVVVFIVANQLEGNLLSPIILSRSTNLHPVTVLLAILVGVGVFGLVGALLAVPTVALVKVILEDYLLDRPAYEEPAVQQGPLFPPEPEQAEGLAAEEAEGTGNGGGSPRAPKPQ